MAPSYSEAVIEAPVPKGSVAAELTHLFFENLFKDLDVCMSLLDDTNFKMVIQPSSLKTPAMDKKTYEEFLRNGLLPGFSTGKATIVSYNIGPPTGNGTQVNVEARSRAVSAVNQDIFGQEYQFVFVVDEPKRKITLIKEYVDSLYMARWNRKQTEAEKAKGML